jgi:hypothetical protein
LGKLKIQTRRFIRGKELSRKLMLTFVGIALFLLERREWKGKWRIILLEMDSFPASS